MCLCFFFFSSRRRHTRCALVTGVQTCALPISAAVSIRHVMHQPIGTLSKGYKRRVGLAQAILHDPEVLILDEPTDGLDPNQKHEVRELIHRMAAEKAIVISTHILEEVQAVRSEEHTSELQSLMSISYAGFCLEKKT